MIVQNIQRKCNATLKETDKCYWYYCIMHTASPKNMILKCWKLICPIGKFKTATYTESSCTCQLLAQYRYNNKTQKPHLQIFNKKIIYLRLPFHLSRLKAIYDTAAEREYLHKIEKKKWYKKQINKVRSENFKNSIRISCSKPA